ncbi:MAG: hypothetical protein HW416_1000 [Chloroflexi bacterium]|nr:hypothetical protein [Chloroflexota bacterium]
MGVFASYFWLWSIIGLLGFMMLYTLGSLMNMVGFLSPVRRVTAFLDDAPWPVKFGVLVAVFGLLGYPSLAHRLWADATAVEIRRAFDQIPAFPGALPSSPTEQMAGLYDPTGIDGIYIIGWFGTTTPFEEVQAHYASRLTSQGWVPQEAASTPDRRRGSFASRVTFRDNSVPSQASYDLVLAQIPPASAEVPADLRLMPTIFAVRLGVVDPRLTTQVAWFIDCLVHRAPTFPTCEAMGWNPMEAALGNSSRKP